MVTSTGEFYSAGRTAVDPDNSCKGIAVMNIIYRLMEDGLKEFSALLGLALPALDKHRASPRY